MDGLILASGSVIATIDIDIITLVRYATNIMKKKRINWPYRFPNFGPVEKTLILRLSNFTKKKLSNELQEIFKSI